MTFKQRFTDLISDSQMRPPLRTPIQGLTGGLNFQSVFFDIKCLVIES